MNPAPNVFLVGPMGAGKSTIGRRLARHFGLAFIDLDDELEARTGASVKLIFELEGEAGFRARESALLAELAQADGRLLATGGGTVLDAGNRALLRSRGFVVWLRASVAQQLRRLERDRKRPLLGGPDRRARLEQL
ncbi:MAG: shikimate kinase, partial [Xanthomonadales bacterium]|nr:shikimate kinase [Xanthomonadales bacterium]